MPVGDLARSPRLTRPGAAAEGTCYLLPESLIAERVARVGRCADFLQLSGLQLTAEQFEIGRSSARLARTESKKSGVRSDKRVATPQCVRGKARPARSEERRVGREW